MDRQITLLDTERAGRMLVQGDKDAQDPQRPIGSTRLASNHASPSFELGGESGSEITARLA